MDTRAALRRDDMKAVRRMKAELKEFHDAKENHRR